MASKRLYTGYQQHKNLMRFRDFESMHPNIHASKIPSKLTVLIALWLWYYWKLKLLPRENSLKIRRELDYFMMLSSMQIAVDALGLYITRIDSLQYHKAQAQCTKIGSNLGFAVRSCRDMESWLTEGMLALS